MNSTLVSKKVPSSLNDSESFWFLAKNISLNLSKSSFLLLIYDDGIFSTSNEKMEIITKFCSSHSSLNAPADLPFSFIIPVPYGMSEVKPRRLKDSSNGWCQKIFQFGWNSRNCPKELSSQTSFYSISSLLNFLWGWYVPKTVGNHPISILSMLHKMQEKDVNRSILCHLEKCNLIHDKQYRFWQQRSTTNLLSFVIHIWYNSLELHRET